MGGTTEVETQAGCGFTHYEMTGVDLGKLTWPKAGETETCFEKIGSCLTMDFDSSVLGTFNFVITGYTRVMTIFGSYLSAKANVALTIATCDGLETVTVPDTTPIKFIFARNPG